MRTRPDIVSQIPLPDGAVDVDEAGYLTDPADWSRAFAQYAAKAEQIDITADHWQVLDFMRAFNDEHGVAADARFVLKFLAETHATDKSGARKLMYRLFPYGYVKQACKMAGMKQPRARSTG